MEISELLLEKGSSEVAGIDKSASLQDLASRLVELRVGATVVTDADNRLIGIVSERDLLSVFASHHEKMMSMSVAEIMTTKVITCTPSDNVADVLAKMDTHAIRHMPVVVDDKLVNIVSIRELTTAYEMLQVEANTDHLTKLANRRLFLENLTNEFERAKRYGDPFSVAMIDIDHFKRVNDTYGHDAGDRVIQFLANALMSEFRTVDRVGRLGGEEFAVLFPKTSVLGAKIACERVIRAVRGAKVDVGGQKIGITISIGLEGMSAKASDGASMLRRADEFLYEAKNTGRDRLVSSESIKPCIQAGPGKVPAPARQVHRS